LRLAARQGPQALIRALQAAVEHERTAFTEEYDAIVARQRAEYEALIERQRTEYEALLEHQRAKYDEQQRVAMEQLERQLLDKVDNIIKAVEVERATLRHELAAAREELDR